VNENIMDEFNLATNLLFPLAGLAVIYLSRILLWKQPKLTGNELKSFNLGFENIHETYLTFYTVLGLSVAFILFLVYQADRVFWEKRVVVLFVIFMAVLAAFDGLFALETKVFPTTTRYNWNSYVYDNKGKFQWVAYTQILLSIVLLLADYVAYASSL
jgi:hypothetical protein